MHDRVPERPRVKRATLVEGDEKLTALHALTEQLAPGRWDEARQPAATELRATWILSLPLDEASAKVRTGPDEDESEDLDLPRLGRCRAGAPRGRAERVRLAARAGRPRRTAAIGYDYRWGGNVPTLERRRRRLSE